MPTKSKQKPAADSRLQLVFPPALTKACRKAAESNGETLGALIRRAAAREIGQPKLAIAPSRGRPKKNPSDSEK